MIEIGSSLRDARLRRGLELRDVERETKIRRQQLEAPESERFEIFPAPAYARAFLREYAEFLGLDGQVYIDELDARFPAEEAPLIVGRPTALSPGRVPLPVVPLAVSALALAVGLLAWHAGAREEGPPLVRPAAPAPATTAAQEPAAPPEREPAPVAPLRLTLTAVNGDCWLSVRVGSRDGEVLFEGLLGQGQTVRFARPRLWIRMGAPWNLEARLNGRRLRGLPPATGNVVVTRAGITPS